MADPTYVMVPSQPLHPNHLPDLRYVLQTLERVKRHGLKNDADLRGQVAAAIVGMRYIIERTEQAAAPSATPSGEGKTT